MTEDQLKNEISYQNLLLYSLVIPSVSEDSESSQSKDPVDMFGYFDSFGTD